MKKAASPPAPEIDGVRASDGTRRGDSVVIDPATGRITHVNGVPVDEPKPNEEDVAI